VIDKVLRPPNIVEVAKTHPDTWVFVRALRAANMVTSLSGTGPFTLFAPTDAAFEKLLTKLGMSMDAFLGARDLKQILMYHILPQTLNTSCLTEAGTVRSRQGATAFVMTHQLKGRNMVKVNDAWVIESDNLASNGMVHIIDEVLLPPSVYDLAMTQPTTSILADALQATNLAKDLHRSGPFTVFAPTNGAFGSFIANFNASKEQLLQFTELPDILQFHVVSGQRYLSTDLTQNMSLASLQGRGLKVEIRGEDVLVQGAKIVSSDIIASNGVVHLIDRVMLPDNGTADTAPRKPLEVAAMEVSFSGNVSFVSGCNFSQSQILGTFSFDPATFLFTWRYMFGDNSPGFDNGVLVNGGEPTSVAFYFTEFLNSLPQIRINANTNEGAEVLSSEFANEMKSGRWFLMVASTTCPNGEMRAQLPILAPIHGDVSQSVGCAINSASQIRGTAALNDRTGLFQWKYTYGDNSPLFDNNRLAGDGQFNTAAFHGPGRPGEIAPPIYLAVESGFVNLEPQQFFEMQSGLWYLSIQSTSCEAGELRAQLLNLASVREPVAAPIAPTPVQSPFPEIPAAPAPLPDQPTPKTLPPAKPDADRRVGETQPQSPNSGAARPSLWPAIALAVLTTLSIGAFRT
jgi:uncharacterized surface protein with fasciclin (FAS1) repeats